MFEDDGISYDDVQVEIKNRLKLLELMLQHKELISPDRLANDINNLSRDLGMYFRIITD